MHPVEPAPRPARARPRVGRASASFLVVLIGAAVTVIACGADEARDAAIGELAVGSWACAPDASGADEQPFTVQVRDGGSFDVVAEDTEAGPGYEISGTWEVADGDLSWGFDEVQARERSVVEGFDDLTLDSTGFTLLWPGIFEANDGIDDPADEQEFLVDAAGTDSVTLRVPGGDPWTCARQ